MQKKRSKKCNYQRPMKQSSWTQRKLTEGNDILSRLIYTCTITVMIILMVPLTNPAKNSVAETVSNDVIEIETEDADMTEGENVLPDPNIGLTLAINRYQEMAETEYIPPPEERMEDYNVQVFISHNDGINVRSEPSTSGEILGSLAWGTPVQVLKKGDGWLYTSDGDFIYEGGTSLEKPKDLISLGEFKFTAYCTCPICCGKNSAAGLTRSGTTPTEGRTISVDRRVIPLGTTVVIDDHEYIAEDTGSAIKGNKIDLFIDSHQRALQYGVQYHEVFVYR